MSDHIGSFLNLKYHITEASHKLDNVTNFIQPYLY